MRHGQAKAAPVGRLGVQRRQHQRGDDRNQGQRAQHQEYVARADLEHQQRAADEAARLDHADHAAAHAEPLAGVGAIGHGILSSVQIRAGSHDLPVRRYHTQDYLSLRPIVLVWPAIERLNETHEPLPGRRGGHARVSTTPASRKSHGRAHSRPALEALEDRRVMSATAAGSLFGGNYSYLTMPNGSLEQFKGGDTVVIAGSTVVLVLLIVLLIVLI